MESEVISSVHGSLHFRFSGSQPRPVSDIQSALATSSPLIPSVSSRLAISSRP